MKAILDEIIVKPCAPDELTEGGLIVPENFRERSAKAIIVSVGDGTKKKPMFLRVGETCFHVKGAGTEIIEKGESLFLMKQQDVLASLKN